MVVTHILGVSEFSSLCELGVCGPGVFPKLVGEFVVDLVIGCPFVYVCEFGLGQS